MPESLTERLRQGGSLGSWCCLASFCSVELMSLQGFDFLVLDMQHGEIAQSHLPGLLGAFPPSGPAAVVRAPSNSYHTINWLFDQGASGVLVPMINSVEDARRAVEAAKYPPLGRRSFGPFRAARYGAKLAQYMESADASATLIVQIEDAEAARDIDAILAIPGIDAVFMGPNDVAFSMLKPGETMRGDPTQWSAFARTPAVIELCEHVMARCRAAGMPFGMTAGSIVEARGWLGRGASFVTAGSDASYLSAGARQAFDRKS